MSDNYAIDKQMERLQQEVAELREQFNEIDSDFTNRYASYLDDRLIVNRRLAALERPAAATADPDDDDDSGAIVGGGPGYKAMIEAEMDKNCDWEGDNADVTPAQPAPAEGIDVERVMALVKQYGSACVGVAVEQDVSAYRQQSETIAERIRAMLGGAR